MTVHDKKGLVPAGAPQPMSFFAPLQREIDRAFSEFGHFAFPDPFGPTPRMDLRETDDGLELTVELPGMDEKDIRLEFADDTLTVSGEKKIETDRSEGGYRFLERRYGAFSRSVRMPHIDAARIRAAMKAGVLTVTAPRLAEAKPATTRIPVQSA